MYSLTGQLLCQSQSWAILHNSEQDIRSLSPKGAYVLTEKGKTNIEMRKYTTYQMMSSAIKENKSG